MSDPYVDRWKQSGRLFVWRWSDESRNYPGWNVTADRSGAESLRQLFALMQRAEWSSQRALKVTNPVPGLVARRRVAIGGDLLVPRRIIFKYRKTAVRPCYWHWEGNWTSPVLIFGSEMLQRLRNALDQIYDGIGDFRVGSQDQHLHGIDRVNVSIWFWPCIADDER